MNSQWMIQKTITEPPETITVSTITNDYVPEYKISNKARVIRNKNDIQIYIIKESKKNTGGPESLDPISGYPVSAIRRI